MGESPKDCETAVKGTDEKSAKYQAARYFTQILLLLPD